MKTFILFLRGINVSGQKLIKMVELREALEKGGFGDVQTYVQSGNLVVKSDLGSAKKVGSSVQKIILDQFGFEVPCLVKFKEEIQKILELNPYDPEHLDTKKIFFIMLYAAPVMERFKEIDPKKYLPEEFQLEGDTIYFYAANGAAKAKLSNNFFEAKLKSNATTRNLNTMRKMVELAGF